MSASGPLERRVEIGRYVEAAPDGALDHVGVGVKDLGRAARAYERLGFTLSPFARHAGAAEPGGAPVTLGTANRCAILERGYIELIAVVDPSRPARGLDRLIARHEGLHIAAFSCDEPRATSERLARSGFGARGTQYLERRVDSVDGPGLARFERVPVEPGDMPEGVIFYIQHLTPELVWQPGLTRHPNRATALMEVMILVANMSEAKERYARFFDLTPDRRGGTRVFNLPRGRVALVDGSSAGDELPGVALPPPPAIVAFTVASPALDETGRLLESNRVAFARRDGRLVVSPRRACGACCIFEPA